MILSRDHSAKDEDGRHPHERATGELKTLTQKGPLKRMLQKPLVVATLAGASAGPVALAGLVRRALRRRCVRFGAGSAAAVRTGWTVAPGAGGSAASFVTG